MSQTADVGRYRLVLDYGNGGYVANDPIALTKEQFIGFTSPNQDLAIVIALLVQHHLKNTGELHPLARTPISQITIRDMNKLEVLLKELPAQSPTH